MLATVARVFVGVGEGAQASIAIERAVALAPAAIATSIDVELARAAVLAASHALGKGESGALLADGRARRERRVPSARLGSPHRSGTRALTGLRGSASSRLVAAQAHKAGF